jgi:hypothetical protein
MGFVCNFTPTQTSSGFCAIASKTCDEVASNLPALNFVGDGLTFDIDPAFYLHQNEKTG